MQTRSPNTRRRKRSTRERIALKRDKGATMALPNFIAFITREHPQHTDLRVPYSGYRLLQSQKWQKLAQDVSGPRGRCVENVNDRVLAEGGSLVSGWLRKKNSINNPRIRFGGDILTAHSVWKRPDGKLFEVTDGQSDAWFAVDPLIGSDPMVRCMIFTEKEEDAVLSAPISVYRWVLPTKPSAAPKFHGLIEPLPCFV